MLADIAIENLGAIPHASLELSGGLTVLTGETGAGKTMVVTGLRLLTGGRADAQRVRSGADRAAVEGRFVLDGVSGTIAEHGREIVDSVGGILDENGEVIASRTVSAQGRSKAYLGGRAVPAASLSDFSAELLTIHGQNDQLRLLNSDRQRDALDRFDPAIAPLAEECAHAFKNWRKLDRDYQGRLKSRMELAQEVDRLEFAIKEISDIDPQPGEDAAIQSLIRRLQDVDELREQAATALGAIDGAEALSEFGGYEGSDAVAASDLVGQAFSAVQNSSDPVLRGIAEQLDQVTTILAELSGELGKYLSELPMDADQLEQSLQRQQALKALTRKYAPDIEGVLRWRMKAEEKLESIDVSPEALEELKRSVSRAAKKLDAANKKLSQARSKAAKKLSLKVTEEIQGLSMPKAIFSVDIQHTGPSVYGTDSIEFRLAPNSQTDPRPLASSASGGELSRVMLALEVILSAGARGTTLVFDEVDAGVGGRAAVEIGRRLAKLAQWNQVIVVTHLAQVAAYADTHLHVAKNVGDVSVASGVENLSDDRRVEELSRMLAGLENTESGRAHAAELLNKARSEILEWRAEKG
ncbi:DNA repair protein RecN [Corynebacterium pseudotuberculosis]|uniref:DNA repair protein RecN n=1 Tax=Corynebacterium pseudotuberculosis 258 TaxID=1168865 RepID=A0AAU8PL54_CORPS|nr:DNA repair protein RecN [Corynebacterium pseudotuberculosis]AER69021.1 DNA repair protein recN [Corynebacterium pseudotuberculosis 1/06-A]AEQ06523.1 DNA repair protein RecN [Corynebacterium pseudotuberculosis CIP 52.97]AFB72320.2 DNA repair protein RecN [Corynebacterium pseudotuberculosis 316]AFH90792.1 DNA repair protein RecN [Corynebacterium pseudotuberculosis 31]AFK16616.1 DNA repair protein RecN [Corynebacterium pseudotuberculosis 258]